MYKSFHFLLIAVWLVLPSLLSGCSKAEKKLQLSGHTMGTTYHITVVTKDAPTPVNVSDAKELKRRIETLLESINQQMSTYLQDSEISQFNRYQKTDWFKVSHDFAFVVDNAQQLSQRTQGAFDISVLPFVELWGFGSKTQYTLPSDKQITALLAETGYDKLHARLQPPALKKDSAGLKIDLSAIAKGFAVDKLSAYLEKQGYLNHLVEIGGEIKAKGKNARGEAWKIAIEQPQQARAAASRILRISDTGVATSGDYRNYYIKDGVRFSHTINPQTGRPVTHKLASVTVVHKSCMIADAYATAIMVMGEIKGKRFILQNSLKANMIIRDADSFKSWSNLLVKYIKKGGDG